MKTFTIKSDRLVNEQHLHTLETVLGRKLKISQYIKINHEWRAFSTTPEAYKNSVVVNMVNQFLNEEEM